MVASAMCAQNVYDNPAFFAAYTQLPRSRQGLSAMYEWPAFERWLPTPVTGMRVLDLGCGMGHIAREVRKRGAAAVLGVDLSARMLEVARSCTNDPGISYEQADLETYVPEAGAFRLVLSSLALHYVADHRRLARCVAASLVPGGRFVFSVEHPIFTAHGSAAWHTGPNGEKLHWPVDRYRDEGERHTHWFVEGVVKYHRTVETYVNTLIESGLRLAGLEEPEGGPEALKRYPDWQEDRRRPMFMVIAADRPDA